jgi:hypothetical protein
VEERDPPNDAHHHHYRAMEVMMDCRIQSAIISLGLDGGGLLRVFLDNCGKVVKQWRTDELERTIITMERGRQGC